MAVLIAVQIFLFVQWEQGMITVVLFLAGIGLCIYKHPVWGTLCFVAVVLTLIA
jgi:hypothetical protein